MPSVPILCPTSVPTICQIGRNDLSIDDFWADPFPDFGHRFCAHPVPTSSTHVTPFERPWTRRFARPIQESNRASRHPAIGLQGIDPE